MRVLAPRFRTSLLALTATGSLLTGVVASTTASAAGPPLSLGQKAVNLAAHQVGKPYRYGAAGPSAFDCSGLTLYSYQRYGRNLPRTAIQQYRSIHRVSVSSARPGDLIFMANSGSSTNANQINHVGIYAGGGYWYVARYPGTKITKQRLWTRNVWAGRP